MGKAAKKKRALTERNRTKETALRSALAQKPGEDFQEAATRTSIVLPIVIIFVASIAVYFNTLFNDFVYDDMTQVVENPWIRDVGNLPDIFSKSVWSFQDEGTVANYYRPLMHVIYMLNYYVFGLKPWGFHFVNVLFHAGNSVLVFFAAARLLLKEQAKVDLTVWPERKDEQKEGRFSFSSLSDLTSTFLSLPFVAALLFAVHPIHTEAVAWVAGLPDLSFSFFYLLSFSSYVVSTTEKQVHPWHYSLSLLSFSLAALCKETALTLPAILVVYDYAIRRDEGSLVSHFRHYIPYVIVTLVYLALRYHALGGVAPVQKRHAYLSAWQYIINVFPLFAHYLEKLIFPFNLNAFYVLHPIFSLFEMRGIISLAVTAAFIFAAFIALKKDGRILLGISIIAIPLLPVLYIPGLGENTFTERYLYLPSAGFVMLVSLIIIRIRALSRGPIVAAFLVATIIALYSAGTVARNRTWKDNHTLFSDTVKKSPDASIPHNMLGTSLAISGRVHEAIEEYRIAIELDPYHANAHSNLGFAYLESGQMDKAIMYLEAAVRLEPGNALYRNNLAYAQSILGSEPANEEQWDKTIEHYSAQVALQPENALFHSMLGIAYGQKGLYEKAVEQFEIAVRLAPEVSAYRNNLERALSMKNSDLRKK